MAPEVDGDRRVAVPEDLRLAFPEGAVCGPAVDEEHRGAGARSIVAERDDFMLVEKPPFLLVHPTKPTGARTLWGELKHLLAFEIANGGQVSLVNRLDRETSGLVLVAKNSGAAREMQSLNEAAATVMKDVMTKDHVQPRTDWPRACRG